MQSVRQAIKDQVHKMVGRGSGTAETVRPRSDDGLFGPQSVCWRVHGDFTTMMIGGVASLLIQMLHPKALAGVWDHSNFRRDMSGRLRRTAQFISGTTYGSTEQAEGLIARVRGIHDRVHGSMPEGGTYFANDPALLTWVHVAEVSSFMRSYLRYRNPLLSADEQDGYYAETSIIAHRLGAVAVPKTRREIERYLGDVRPELRFDARTREVARALLSQPAPSLAVAPFQSLVLDAGVDLLPDWAAAMHGLRLHGSRKPLVRAGALGASTVVRWALR